MKKILVTNDDGIDAPGLRALAQALKPLGEIWVVAPEKPQNAVGRCMTLHKPLRLRKEKKWWYAVNGTPADCITLTLAHLLKDALPKLVVSGINNGWNLGDDVTNSGTVSGALEGMLYGIPSMAVSLEGTLKSQYAMAGEVAVTIAWQILKNGLPPHTILNVNVPGCTNAQLAGLQITSLSQRRYHNPVVENIDPRGNRYFWIAGERISWSRRSPSDYEAVSNNLVSITPLHLDLTDYSALTKLKSWEQDLSFSTSYKKIGVNKKMSRTAKDWTK
ncbi:MAG: 5'/3'-nucleotidase SurE [Nitrospirales bacterium]|nr:5'/3'-nucleotidase SurE [Nitrospirales bacterium]